MSSTTTNPTQMITVSKGVSSSGVNITSDSNMLVYGSASDTTISSGGGVSVYGGLASGTTINGGTLSVLIKGTALETTINSGGVFTLGYIGLLDGGVASGITINNGGLLDVTGQGVASDVVVNNGGKINILGGVYHIGRTDLFYESGTATGITISGGGEVAVSSGGIASDTTVSSGGEIVASSGGILSNTAISSGGEVIASAGGSLSGTTISSGGVAFVVDGGTLSGATVDQGGTVYVLPGGSVNTISGNGDVISATIGLWADNGNIFEAGSGSSLNGVVVSQGTSANIFSGGLLGSAVINSGGELITSSGGIASGTIINNGGEVLVSSGGVASGGIVHSGGIINVFSGASVSDVTFSMGGTVNVYSDSVDQLNVSNSGTLNIYSSSVASDVTVTDNGTVVISSGGTASGTTLSYDGTLLVDDGGTAAGTIVNNGTFTADSGGVALGTTVNGGTFTVASSGSAVVTIVNGGWLMVNSGGTAAGTILNGSMAVDSGGIATDTTVNSNSWLGVVDGGILSGGTYIASGGTMELYGATSGAGIINIASGGTLQIEGTTMPTNVISGLPDGARIDIVSLASVTHIEATASSTTLVGKDNVGNAVTYTLNTVNTIQNADGTYRAEVTTDYEGGLYLEVCFLAGSMIQTPSGPTAVEALRVGDKIVAYEDGAETTRHVTWDGHAHCTVRPHLPDDEAGYPVRILRGAITEGVPYKDMLITPEHCLFFNGRFVPVRMLVNGRSIFYDKSITAYNYYHVETERHSVIMADGMFTESYLDTGNRRAFRQNGTVVSIGKTNHLTWDDAAAPLDVSRAFVEPLFRQIKAHADKLECVPQPASPVLTNEAGLHIITEAGAILHPVRREGDRVMFMISTGVQSVRIASRTSRPCDVIGPFVDDRRAFGVAVGEVMMFENNHMQTITAHLTATDLKGWNTQERPESRWTSGNAFLPLGTRRSNGISLMTIQIKAAGPYLSVCQDSHYLPCTQSSLVKAG